MPLLKSVLAAIDEVDEKYRDLYTERSGKWEFTGVEGLKTQADIDRQLAANQKTRGDLSEAQKQLKALQDKLQGWDELDPEDVKTKLEKLATYEAGNSVPELAKNFEGTVAARVAQVLDGKVKSETTKLNRQLTELTEKLAQAGTVIQTFETRETHRTISDQVRQAATSQKVLPEAVGDLLIVAGSELKLVDGKVQTEDGRDATQWLEDRKSKTPFWWPQSRGTGANGSDASGLDGKANPFSREGWNMTAAAGLLKADPAKAGRLAELAGVPKNKQTGEFMFHVMPPERK